jgi:hypothetical protein
MFRNLYVKQYFIRKYSYYDEEITFKKYLQGK